MATVVSTTYSHVPMAIQLHRIQQRLATPQTRSACVPDRTRSMERLLARGTVAKMPKYTPPVNAVLRAHDVVEIRASSEPTAVLSRRYQVDRRTIRDARKGVTWQALLPVKQED